MHPTLSAMVRFSAVGSVALAALAGMAACSSSGGTAGGTGSVSGTVAGTTFAVASEVAVLGPAYTSCSGGGGFTADGGTFDAGSTCTSSGQAVLVLLTNRSDATCSAVLSELATKTPTSYASYDALELAVVVESGAVATGSYPIVSSLGSPGVSSGASGLLVTTTSSCGAGLDVKGSGGSITLSQLSSNRVSGTYSVTFGSQGTFTGSFDVPICDLPDGGFTEQVGDGGKPACTP